MTLHTSLSGARLPETVTTREHLDIWGTRVERIHGEFWTSGQRQASSIHEVSYRGCFKPQLPAFFIEMYTREGDCVYDPFSGRGTTVIEAGLRGRRVIANDINPLSRLLTRPRFFLPTVPEVAARLGEIPPGDRGAGTGPDLSMFYHARTEAEIVSLRTYLLSREEDGSLDTLDEWIRMVATNRLTGHSPGFFSVYTLPPNQAVLPERQAKINRERGQVPEYRDTKELIVKKTRSLLRTVTPEERARLRVAGETGLFLSSDARETPPIPDGSVQLTVTSPPFLDVVQYSKDNWLRCWFCGIDTEATEKRITVTRSLPEWKRVMQQTFQELFRITREGGYVAFEVGEVRRGTLCLDEVVIPLGVRAGFTCERVFVNTQPFTKTSHIWGVDNNSSGTNTNRIVVFRKGEAGEK
ncbi:MAG: site-specific DNA-methyltransferase [Methanolinea sp.]|nr:site-specific DNA-methyltransferase [Methanolinea sp.]